MAHNKGDGVRRSSPTLGVLVDMMKRRAGAEPADPAREARIVEEIVVDAYGPEERALGWYYYAENEMSFPFQAFCIETRVISPLKKGEEITVVGLVAEEECSRELFVSIEWDERNLAVPLSQLKAAGADKQTTRVVEDWLYWKARNYQY